ncbi:MAG: aminoglycoside phosphotransferase family protein [Ferruginibacter sp.]
MLQNILRNYFSKPEILEERLLGSGLIHSTWKLNTSEGDFILQKVNEEIFKNPDDIAANINLVSDYLKKHSPAYTFIPPVKTVAGESLVYSEEGIFRLFPFVAGSHSKEVVHTAAEAYEAAAQFGKFTKLLSGLNTAQLKITLPAFHDLSLRYAGFLEAIKSGNQNRVAAATGLIKTLMSHAGIVTEYELIKSDPNFKLRVTHHDTKISNVLFDSNDKGICVIDLDTLMSGYFMSDVGDMMRTYLSPVSEEETDFSKITIREDFYKAIVEGYYSEMKTELTGSEKKYFFYAGKFMIYMQAIRFASDHLNNDVYYGAKYKGHNFVRAGNQVILLQKLIDKDSLLNNNNLAVS